MMSAVCSECAEMAADARGQQRSNRPAIIYYNIRKGREGKGNEGRERERKEEFIPPMFTSR